MKILILPFRCLCIAWIIIFSLSAFAQPAGITNKIKAYHFTNYDMKSGIDTIVSAIYAGKYGEVFAGVYSGLVVGKRDEIGTYHFRKYLSPWLGRGVYVDAKRLVYVATDNGVWIGEDDGGGGYYFFSHYAKSSGLASSWTNCVYVDEKGIMYVGTGSPLDQDGGLSIGEKDSSGKYHFTNYDVKSGLGSKNVWRIFVDKEGVIYAGTFGGLSVGEKDSTGKYHFTNYTISSGLGGNNVFGIYVDINKIIYAGSYAGGLSIGKKDSTGKYRFIKYTMKSGLGSNNISSIYVNKQGVIFAATEGGLSIGEKDSAGLYHFINYDKSIGLGSNDVRDVSVDSDQIIYAATTAPLGTDNGGLSIGKED